MSDAAKLPESATPTDTASPLDRRQFIQGVTAVLSGVLGVLNPLAALLPSRSWAVDLHALSADQSTTLLAMIHTIAPHEGLDEAAYALVVSALDADAANADAGKAQLTAGLAGLGADFAHDSETIRVQKLQSVESSPFFQGVRLKTLMVLYNNPIAWAHFGYEGEAFSKGGYLLRGFNDLKWLPDVPLAASGPMPV
jgi:hypothetical protein